MAGVKEIFQGFASRPGRGTPKSGRLFRQTHSAPGKTPPGQEVRQAVSSGRKFPPAGMPPGQDRRKGNSPEKYGRRKERSHEWPVHSPFPFPAGTCQAAGNSVAKQMQSEKCPSKGKACCRTCRCAGGSSEKETYTAHTFCRKREEDEGTQEKEQRNTGDGNLPFPRKTENVPADRPRHREKTGHGKGS